jgi:hypothetical protein
VEGQATPARPVRRAAIDERVLGSAVAPLEELPTIDEDLAPSRITVRERASTRTRTRVPSEAAAEDAPTEAAPLEDVVTVAAPEPVVLAPTTSPALGRPRTATIDPFE